MNLVLRGVRIIDPASRSDRPSHDVWLRDGAVVAAERSLTVDGVTVVDLRRPAIDEECVLAPAFIDLHAHLREPGDDRAETVQSGSRAAAAGGFGTVLAMANTRPPIDFPFAVTEACRLGRAAPVRVLQACALTRNLEGRKLVDFEACAAAGAVAFSDDGRNGAPPAVLSEAIRRAARCERTVLVHPEDEALIASLVRGHTASVTRCANRPPQAEVNAVRDAVHALRDAGRGRLHLQHLSTAAAVEHLAVARRDGLAVTAEATPHHLTLDDNSGRSPQHRVNPPLRTADDVHALRDALRDGVIDAIATDHAPHTEAAKRGAFEDVAPGMIGLESALATCLQLVPSVLSIPDLVERLTCGPRRVLGDAVDVPWPSVDIGARGTFTLFDPLATWTVEPSALRSLSANTPLLGAQLRGRVLLTVVEGRTVHADTSVLPLDDRVAAHV